MPRTKFGSNTMLNILATPRTRRLEWEHREHEDYVVQPCQTYVHGGNP